MTPAGLGPVFTLQGAIEAGVRKDQVYGLVAAGEIERIGRGVYVESFLLDPAWESLAAASLLQPEATMCLTSALSYYDLSDEIPRGSDIALPRGVRQPAGFDHVFWHGFSATTFDVGKERIEVHPGIEVAVYSAERTIVDVFRLMHREGSDVAYEALRRWVRIRGNSPASLMRVTEEFPVTQSRIRTALEILL